MGSVGAKLEAWLKKGGNNGYSECAAVVEGSKLNL